MFQLPLLMVKLFLFKELLSLSACAKEELKKFNKEFFSNLPSRVVQAKEKMENVQRLIQLSPLNVNLHHEESVAVKEYGDFSRAEESFLKQKSRDISGLGLTSSLCERGSCSSETGPGGKPTKVLSQRRHRRPPAQPLALAHQQHRLSGERGESQKSKQREYRFPPR
jgi:hypothetical protein